MLKNIFKKKKYTLSEKDLRWNKFIDDICIRDISLLSPIQKNAVLCFWYDAEMNNGGHCGYFDCCPETKPEELIYAINQVAYKEIADNYELALTPQAENNEWTDTDNAFYKFEPSLCDCLMDYVEKNKESIFD